MSDYPPVYPPVTSTFNDFSSGPPQDNVVHAPPPSYGFLNPSVLNNANNIDQKPTQYQPQPQWSPTGTFGNTQNMYGVPTIVNVNPDLNNVENYIVWSVLNILCCCLCLGFVGCYYSLETNNAKVRGDIQGALTASRNARTINIITTCLGLIINTIYILYSIGTI
jgi:hypothetical protein